MKMRKIMASALAFGIVCGANAAVGAYQSSHELTANALKYTLTNEGVHSISNAPLQERAKEIIAMTGTDIHDVYNYIRTNNYYKFIESPKSLEEIEALGWEYFAEYSLDNKYLVNYYFAAVSSLLYEAAGYETRIVKGTGTSTYDYYWNQVLIGKEWLNYDACNGFEGVTDEYITTPNMPNINASMDTKKDYTIERYIYHSFYGNSSTQPEIIFGDPTGDGKIDAKDSSFVLVEYAKLSTGDESALSEDVKSEADVNKDSKIDSKDASAILSYYAYVSTGGTDSIQEFLKTE